MTFGKVNIALFVFGSPLLSLSDPPPIASSFRRHIPLFEGSQRQLGMCKEGGFYYTFPLLPMT